MKKKFRYFLKSEDGQYYYTLGRQVLTTSTPTPLQFDPVDWAETSIRWARGTFFSGIFRSLSLSITFVQDGRRILAHIAATQRGYASKCRLVIERLDTFDWLHKPYFEGDIDFSQGRLMKNQYQLEILDGGLGALLIAKQNTPYEIPINPGGAIRTNMDGINLRTAYNYVPLPIVMDPPDPLELDIFRFFATAFTLQEGDYEVATTANQQTGFILRSATTLSSPNLVFKASQAMSAIITGSFEVLFTHTTGAPRIFSVYALIVGDNDTIKTKQLIFSRTPAVPSGQPTAITVSLNSTLNLAAKDRVYLAFYSGSSVAKYEITANPDDRQLYKFAIRATFRLPASECSGDRYGEFARKLFAKVTGGRYGFRSDFLNTPGKVSVDNRPYNTVVTSGLALRRLGTVDKPAKIKTSPGDMVKDTVDRWLVGLGVEKDALGNEIVRMEHESHFYNDTQICHLGTIEYPGQPFIQDMLYPGLQVGVSKQDYDELNGIDEPNMQQNWDFPVIQGMGKIWDMVSPYRWDMYGIEYARSRNIGKETVDDSSDDSVFVFEVNDSPSPIQTGNTTTMLYTLARRQNDSGNSATGLLFPSTAYNLALSPKRNLLRNAPMIRAALWQQDGQVIKFQTNNKNPDVASNLGSGLIVEKQDIPVESLGAPLYLPKLFEFKARAPNNFPALMDANPYGRVNFRVEVDGQLHEFGGHVDEVKIKPGTNDVAEWSLIVCRDVDLSKLV